MDIPCPERFSFEPKLWPAWRQRFERFRTASDLATKTADRQISMLLHCMGEHSEDIFSRFTYTTDESNTNYAHVLQKFDSHFAVERNLIFERAQFNRRQQEPRELADTFIATLHKTCRHMRVRRATRPTSPRPHRRRHMGRQTLGATTARPGPDAGKSRHRRPSV